LSELRHSASPRSRKKVVACTGLGSRRQLPTTTPRWRARAGCHGVRTCWKVGLECRRLGPTFAIPDGLARHARGSAPNSSATSHGWVKRGKPSRFALVPQVTRRARRSCRVPDGGISHATQLRIQARDERGQKKVRGWPPPDWVRELNDKEIYVACLQDTNRARDDLSCQTSRNFSSFELSRR